MEFSEKLQELRKHKELTQDELAEQLYVSRTAISKWESGRGYPSIESLKLISKYFGVSIDELLSNEELIVLAENDNKKNIIGVCDVLLGIVDIMVALMILLPLYPNTVEGYIYGINLLSYSETTLFNKAMYYGLFIGIIIVGIAKLALEKLFREKEFDFLNKISLGLYVFAIMFLAVSRQPYATALIFVLFLVKIFLYMLKIRNK